MGSTVIRLIALILLAPFWLPLVRTLWREFLSLLHGTGRISHTPRSWGDMPEEPPGDELIQVSHHERGPFRYVSGGKRDGRPGRNLTRGQSGGALRSPRAIVSRNAGLGRRRRGA